MEHALSGLPFELNTLKQSSEPTFFRNTVFGRTLKKSLVRFSMNSAENWQFNSEFGLKFQIMCIKFQFNCGFKMDASNNDL